MAMYDSLLSGARVVVTTQSTVKVLKRQKKLTFRVVGFAGTVVGNVRHASFVAVEFAICKQNRTAAISNKKTLSPHEGITQGRPRER